MTNIRPKSPEALQSSLAALAHERITDSRGASLIYKDLAKLAMGGVDVVSRTTIGDEYHYDDNGTGYRVEKGTELTVATSEDYVDFMRSVGGVNYETIDSRVDYLQAYADFEPIVSGLREELSDPVMWKLHSNFLGSGSNAMAFSIEKDGKKYAVRMPKGNATGVGAVDDHMASAALGRGVPHLEQMVAASYRDGVTVSEIMSGRELSNLTPSEVSQVSEDHLAELVDTLTIANQRNIAVDPKPSNLFYDVENGYGIIDYISLDKASLRHSGQSLGSIVGGMTPGIMSAGYYGKSRLNEATAEDYAKEVALIKANYEVLSKYRSVVEEKLDGEDLEEALRQIDRGLSRNYDAATDPDWIAKQLDRNATRRRLQEERQRRAGGLGGASPEPDFI